jgi:hypothetical protein
MVQLASGVADSLSGCYFDVETDDLDGLVARADEIRPAHPATSAVANKNWRH